MSRFAIVAIFVLTDRQTDIRNNCFTACVHAHGVMMYSRVKLPTLVNNGSRVLQTMWITET